MRSSKKKIFCILASPPKRELLIQKCLQSVYPSSTKLLTCKRAGKTRSPGIGLKRKGGFGRGKSAITVERWWLIRGRGEMVVLSRNSTVVSAIWLGLHKKGAILNQDRPRGREKSSAIHLI